MRPLTKLDYIGIVAFVAVVLLALVVGPYIA